ncbi:hypothetical protein BDU57DRAFT_525781 [Ampelomyces quisqualis]|uniref:Uncharacterized protein n=1 Tax=Ampelomyces quisqualis TaxID=50730 RepID=A0A6A5QZ96_AMPQU|nr:hypothetical protein BDU57DRAFT_525781 [Ampelomyces quisqualis]
MYQAKNNDGFLSKQSSTWLEIGVCKAEFREELGFNARVLYGLDSVGLIVANSGGTTLQNEDIKAVVDPRTWVGRLGVDVKSSNFAHFENPHRSLIKTFRSHQERRQDRLDVLGVLSFKEAQRIRQPGVRGMRPVSLRAKQHQPPL